MSILSDKEISRLCDANPPLIENYIDWDKQLQPAGFDFSLAKVFSLTGAGGIRSFNKVNDLPGKIEVPHDDGVFKLDPGYYLIAFNEVVAIPNDIAAIGKARSTLIRYGAQLNSGIWDPGFQGKSQCGLNVLNNSGIELDLGCTLLHLAFFHLDNKSLGFQHNSLYLDENGDFKDI